MKFGIYRLLGRKYHNILSGIVGYKTIFLSGAPVPECEDDGSFKLLQCHVSTGYCWCVNKSNGEERFGTRKGELFSHLSIFWSQILFFPTPYFLPQFQTPPGSHIPLKCLGEDIASWVEN